MDNCLKCDKALTHEKGKRKKKFCNDTCRSNYWQKNNKKEQPQYVSFKTFQALKDKMDLMIAEAGQKETKTTPKDSLPAKEEKYVEAPETNNSEIVNNIAEIKKEKVPKERDTFFGRKAWAIDQSKRILELEKQLK